MKLMITNCIFVLDNEQSHNIRKNDLKSIKILVNAKGQLINIPFESKKNIKDIIRNKLSEIVNKNIYHLEQVYTLAEKKYCIDDEVNVIYITVTNKENIKSELKEYKLIDFDILNNDTIIYDNDDYKYKTEQIISSGSIEYIHNIKSKDIRLEKDLLQLLIAYKYLRSRIENTDILFKFMPQSFTLEDLRLVYEKITGSTIDKSNFRKKIIKYCEPINKVINNKGFRPTQLYRYKSNFDDVWL